MRKLEATAALGPLAARMPGLTRRGSVTWRNATVIRQPSADARLAPN